MPPDTVDSDGNLVLLCSPHHKLVDKVAPEKFPVATLIQWKTERELDRKPRWADLPDRTEEQLQRVVREQTEVFTSRVDDALRRFEQIDSQAAAMLEGLIDELASLRVYGNMPDPDTVSQLHDAALELRGIDADLASMLHLAGENLHDLPGKAEAISVAADKLSDAVARAQSLM